MNVIPTFSFNVTVHFRFYSRPVCTKQAFLPRSMSHDHCDSFRCWRSCSWRPTLHWLPPLLPRSRHKYAFTPPQRAWVLPNSGLMVFMGKISVFVMMHLLIHPPLGRSAQPASTAAAAAAEAAAAAAAAEAGAEVGSHREMPPGLIDKVGVGSTGAPWPDVSWGPAAEMPAPVPAIRVAGLAVSGTAVAGVAATSGMDVEGPVRLSELNRSVSWVPGSTGVGAGVPAVGMTPAGMSLLEEAVTGPASNNSCLAATVVTGKVVVERPVTWGVGIGASNAGRLVTGRGMVEEAVEAGMLVIASGVIEGTVTGVPAAGKVLAERAVAGRPAGGKAMVEMPMAGRAVVEGTVRGEAVAERDVPRMPVVPGMMVLGVPMVK